MIVGSPREIFKSEARVSMTPESSKQIKNLVTLVFWKLVLDYNLIFQIKIIEMLV